MLPSDDCRSMSETDSFSWVRYIKDTIGDSIAGFDGHDDAYFMFDPDRTLSFSSLDIIVGVGPRVPPSTARTASLLLIVATVSTTSVSGDKVLRVAVPLSCVRMGWPSSP